MPEPISRETVMKVARLARLHLTDAEADRMTTQLAGMLEHFRDVDALDLSNVEPLNQPIPLSNVLRDRPSSSQSKSQKRSSALVEMGFMA